jgi:hypothetical protein
MNRRTDGGVRHFTTGMRAASMEKKYFSNAIRCGSHKQVRQKGSERKRDCRKSGRLVWLAEWPVGRVCVRAFFCFCFFLFDFKILLFF